MSETKLFEGVEVIYFDLDDTLCGYWDAAKAALKRTFVAWPVPGHTAAELLTAWADAFNEFCPGVRHSEWYERYLESGEHTRVEQMRQTLLRVGVEDASLAKKLGDTYAHERDAALSLFPESKELLEALTGRFVLGVITNGPTDTQRQELESLGIGGYFQHVFIEGEMGIGKPAPAVYRRAQEAVGVAPEHILMVGNSYDADVAGALKAGWHTVWVRKPSDVSPNSRTGKPEEKPTGAPSPDLVVHDLREILPHLPYRR